MVSVIIPAAGTGSRLGDTPKQFRLLGAGRLLLHTAKVFDHHPLVSELVVVGPQDNLAFTRDFLGQLKTPFKVVQGGETRQKSVQAGFEALSESTEIVLIHDAARPFVSSEMIKKVIQSTKITGAAAVALPVTDTVRYGEEDRFTKSISRDGLYAMQTPQGFKYDLLQRVFSQSENISHATDDVELMGAIGQAVQIVEGDSWNIKITTKPDWELAELIYQIRSPHYDDN